MRTPTLVVAIILAMAVGEKTINEASQTHPKETTVDTKDSKLLDLVKKVGLESEKSKPIEWNGNGKGDTDVDPNYQMAKTQDQDPTSKEDGNEKGRDVEQNYDKAGLGDQDLTLEGGKERGVDVEQGSDVSETGEQDSTSKGQETIDEASMTHTKGKTVDTEETKLLDLVKKLSLELEKLEPIGVKEEGGADVEQNYDAAETGDQGSTSKDMDTILAAEVGLKTLPKSSKVPDSISHEKRVTILASLSTIAPIASAVFGLGSFIYGIVNGQDRLAELREINQKLELLDGKLTELQGQLGDVLFGQQWLEGAVLYGRDIQRLNYFINYLDNNLSLGSDGQLVPANQAANWANAVLDLGSDGVGQVLHNLHDMMMGTSGIFGRHSLFLLYESHLDQDSDGYWSKVKQFLEFAFSIQTAGYASWATALNLKGRESEVAGIVDRGRNRLDSQRQFLQRFTKEWPTGTYGLPRTNTGCPVAAGVNWRTGYRYQDTEDVDPSNQWTNGLHFDGDFEESHMKQKFCMKTTSGDGDGNWPSGSYCVFKRGGCPGGFQPGEIFWDDEDTNNGNSLSGVVPDGSYDSDTLIRYCCRNDGDANSPISLPNRSPFYLFRYRQGCQRVSGMTVREEFFRWDDEDLFNADRREGAHPYDDGGSSDHKLHYCYYS